MKRRLGKIAVAFFVLVLATGAAPWAQGQTFTVLYSFTGGPDGANPYAGLVMDKAGNLYGATLDRGGAGFCAAGCGAVFKVDTSGNITVLHSFTNSGGDGYAPYGTLIIDQAGNLYGTTGYGGVPGYGIVFKLDTSSSETVLHSFTGSDGATSNAGLIMDTAGNLYGTTELGGTGTCNAFIPGCGTVFKVDSSGNQTVLHRFTNSSGDGGFLPAGLVRDQAGNLYGTTAYGGSGTCNSSFLPGCGTVFKLDPSGNETMLHSFTGSPHDGNTPFGALIMDNAGNLYGTTDGGGAFGFGTVFKLDPAGNEMVLHSFGGSPGDGAFPTASLIMDAAGNLYGTTGSGGASSACFSGCGTVFKVDTVWQ